MRQGYKATYPGNHRQVARLFCNLICKFTYIEEAETVYKNIECTIRKGALYVKPTTRGCKKQGG